MDFKQFYSAPETSVVESDLAGFLCASTPKTGEDFNTQEDWGDLDWK